jgi:hypothetical protein
MDGCCWIDWSIEESDSDGDDDNSGFLLPFSIERWNGADRPKKDLCGHLNRRNTEWWRRSRRRGRSAVVVVVVIVVVEPKGTLHATSSSRWTSLVTLWTDGITTSGWRRWWSWGTAASPRRLLPIVVVVIVVVGWHPEVELLLLGTGKGYKNDDDERCRRDLTKNERSPSSRSCTTTTSQCEERSFLDDRRPNANDSGVFLGWLPTLYVHAAAWKRTWKRILLTWSTSVAACWNERTNVGRQEKCRSPGQLFS